MASIFPSRRSYVSPARPSFAIRFQPAPLAAASVASSTPFATRIRGWQTSPPPQPPPTTLLPPPYDLPISVIDSFFRDVAIKNGTALDSGECFSLTLTGVPSSAVPCVERRLDYLASGPISSAKSGKLDYNIATKTLIITCPTRSHEYMSLIYIELLTVINANDREFYGSVYRDIPAMQIVPTGAAGVPLTFAAGLSRQPDGSLSVLRHPFPFMVWEILDHMPLSDMPRKLKEYFGGTRGRVRIVMIIKLERQNPPNKRKRGPAEDEDDSPRPNAPMFVDREATAVVDAPLVDNAAVLNPTPGAHDAQSELPALSPPVGSLIRGVFWVYGCQLTPTADNTCSSKIIALHNEQANILPPSLSPVTNNHLGNSTHAVRPPASA